VTCWPLPEGRRWRLRSSSRVRFSEAVPLRSDRRELRRRLRAVGRAARAERKRRVTAGLSALSRRRVRISSVSKGVLGDELLEFSDGTRIWLEVRDGAAALRRLAVQSGRSNLYLRRVEPCFGCSWYQLDLSGPGGTGPTVLARVKRYESKTTWVSWVPSSRIHRRHGESRGG
jgi:hypothetical protein